jgi:hypothetical protein
MLSSQQDAENRYDLLRRQALEAAEQISSPGHRFTEIDAVALNALQAWEGANDRLVDWNWAALRSDFRRRYPKRFEVAVWNATSLLALSLGRPTYAGRHMRLDIVEARPHTLGSREPALPDVLLAYGIYAKLLNANSIRIMNPINIEVKAYYERSGYTYIAKHNYLFRELS